MPQLCSKTYLFTYLYIEMLLFFSYRYYYYYYLLLLTVVLVAVTVEFPPVGSIKDQKVLEITIPSHFEAHLSVPPPLFLPFLEGFDKLEDQPKHTCNRTKSALISRFGYY